MGFAIFCAFEVLLIVVIGVGSCIDDRNRTEKFKVCVEATHEVDKCKDLK